MPRGAGRTNLALASTRSRVIEVDVTRVLATLFMVQGHTIDVLLAPQLRQGFFYNGWLFLRGLTAPTFLLLAGMSFTLASLKYWDSYLTFSPKFFKRVRRFGIFVLLGYAMHLPVSSFRNLAGLDSAGWQSWFQVDVLQCIGGTLIFLQLLLLLCKTPKRFAQAALGLCVFVVLASPLAGVIEWRHVMPLSLASYLNFRTGSLFPLFPWSAYILLGAAMGYGVHLWRSGASSLRWLLPVGAGLLILAGMARLPDHLYTQVDFWTTSPSLFFLRVGCVSLLLTAVSLVTQWVPLPGAAVSSLAQESLTIYFIHVSILYGSVWNLGLRQLIGPTLSGPATLTWIAVMVLSMVMLGLTWHWLKQSKPQTSYLLPSAAALAAIAYCCV
ncbi:MAG TPA: heparan-alpha-glucosaminide N-acetyltransferase domain-containing protein [Terriglobales bacterium]|nr:heparan-alpha-glucosaminide N-acetyltransferase domain-containing protein [Terriglobales bacterium]